jgi:hypothetical protein
MQVVDPFGNVSTYSQSVNVLGNTGVESLAIYNSAGELVHTVQLQNVPATLNGFSFAGGVGTLVGGLDPSTGKPRGQWTINLSSGQGAAGSVTWNGMSDSGYPVSSGIYTVKLVNTEAGKGVTVMVKSVTVLNAPGSPAQSSAASAIVAPNPLMGSAAAGSNTSLTLTYTPSLEGSGVAHCYNLAGELVAEAADMGSGRLSIPVGHMAGGIYLVDFEIRAGAAVLGRKIIKVVVLR